MKKHVLNIIFIILLSVYGCQQESIYNAPILITNKITAITDSSCISGGTFKSIGNSEIISKGVCWSTETGPTIANSKTNDGKNDENFESKITNLNPNTEYFVRAYITNNVKTYYGNELGFTTLGTTPIINTINVYDINTDYAYCKCELVSNGGYPIQKIGFCWSRSHNPTINDSIKTNSINQTVIIDKISILSPGTTYYVRGFAINEIGIGYGNEIEFTTPGTLPIITTLEITDTSYFFARCKSKLIDNGNLTITSNGICWSKNQVPTINDYKTSESTVSEQFTSNLVGLEPNTLYYVRAYATNSIGTGYGNTLTFKTKLNGYIQDIDGNTYNTILIGNQVWTAENLRSTHYANGDIIPLVNNNTEWKKLTTGALSFYDSLSSNGQLYGLLYNWYAVEDSRNLCPTGWHVPTELEWNSLFDTNGGIENIGGKLKSTLTSPSPDPRWDTPNVGAINELGFSALPGGFRDHLGNYAGIRLIGFWWYGNDFNPDKSNHLLLRNSSTAADNPIQKKTYGMSIRCIKN